MLDNEFNMPKARRQAPVVSPLERPLAPHEVDPDYIEAPPYLDAREVLDLAVGDYVVCSYAEPTRGIRMPGGRVQAIKGKKAIKLKLYEGHVYCADACITVCRLDDPSLKIVVQASKGCKVHPVSGSEVHIRRARPKEITSIRRLVALAGGQATPVEEDEPEEPTLSAKDIAIKLLKVMSREEYHGSHRLAMDAQIEYSPVILAVLKKLRELGKVEFEEGRWRRI
jgi:hypothetical protein